MLFIFFFNEILRAWSSYFVFLIKFSIKVGIVELDVLRVWFIFLWNYFVLDEDLCLNVIGIIGICFFKWWYLFSKKREGRFLSMSVC